MMEQKGKRLFLWLDKAPFEAQCAGQERPSLTAFPVEGSLGAVIVIPGGGYSHKAEHEGAPIAEMLNKAGVSAFVLDYRVAPCPHESPLCDARRAIRVVRALRYKKVAVLGFSAGGNLACCAATLYDEGNAEAEDPLERLSSRPDGLIACYSVVSLTENTHIGSRCCLLGEQSGDEQLARRYSAERHVTPASPPAFIWHTADDAAVPVENSLSLAAAYSRCGVPFELHVFPYGRHGLGLALDEPVVAQWTQLCVRWLKEGGYAVRGE